MLPNVGSALPVVRIVVHSSVQTFTVFGPTLLFAGWQQPCSALPESDTHGFPQTTRFAVRKLTALVQVLAVVSCSALAQAQCSTGANATTGVNLCFPNAGSTLLYPATIEFGSSPQSTYFQRVIVYDNNRKVDDLPSLPNTLIDYSLKNGFHNVVVNAWTSDGRLYQAAREFTVIGYGIDACKAHTVGVTLCAPTGGLQPNNAVPVSMAAKGHATITAWKLYVDNAVQMSSSQTGTPNSLLTSLSLPAGTHNLTVVAWDKYGAVYKASRQLTAFYMRNCNPRTGVCFPGIVPFQPAGFGADQAADVSSPFTFEADVEDNPSPTTSMTLFLDGVRVVANSGPGIIAQLSAKPGTHYIVVQATDTAGKVYEAYGNVNVR